MNSLVETWNNMTLGRRAVVVGAVLGMFVGILLLARGTGSRDMALLYAGLDGQAAGEVLTALDQAGVPYQVQGNAVMVPAEQRDQLRMSLAAQNLPANGVAGYELLDSLSGFGTTSQMFDAAYWRAKEGELARTMLAGPHIRSARVHISAASGQPFRRQDRPTAAVTVAASSGTITTDQAEALRFLVASSVPGMSPVDVAVIDDAAGLVPPRDSVGGTSGDERALDLKERVERILAARVGRENVAVEVSVETVTASETIIERLIDPDSRVAISTDQQESASRAEDTGRGDVTVASNLPEGDAAGNGGQSTSQNTETRAVTNFELSETQREVERRPGDIARLTVAVLLDTVEVTAADGTVTEAPRPEAELEALRELVASAVGFNEQRGDQITIHSLAFDPAAPGAAGTEATEAETPLDLAGLIEKGLIAAVVLVLGLFVVRPALIGKRPEPELDSSGAAVETALPEGLAPPQSAQQLPAPDGEPDRDPAERLRSLIEARRDEAVQVLQSWVEPGATR